MKKGRYIVLEGNDATGKSSQAERLAEYFASLGENVVVVEEPGSDDVEKSTPVANELRLLIKNGDLARSPEINLALFSAARRELWYKKILPELDKDSIVISSRNYFSTLAYQGKGEGIDASEIIRMTRLFTDERYMKPDYAIILFLDEETREKRLSEREKLLVHPDAFEKRDRTFQDKVSGAYMDIAKKYNVPTVCADSDIETVHGRILKFLQ